MQRRAFFKPSLLGLWFGILSTTARPGGSSYTRAYNSPGGVTLRQCVAAGDPSADA